MMVIKISEEKCTKSCDFGTKQFFGKEKENSFSFAEQLYWDELHNEDSPGYIIGVRSK